MTDCLDEWPEPIVPVQTLSEGGGDTVPDRYIRQPSDRPGADPCGDFTIPVIDLGGPDWEATVRAISDSCRSWGFFQAVNHGVAPELLREARRVWRDFFHLPLEFKQRYANSPRTYEGYGSRLGVEKGAVLDWDDYYFLQIRPAAAKNPDRWPSLPPSLREVVEEYGAEVVKLGGRVMAALSQGLGLEAEYLQRAFGGDDADVGACLRANFYPRCPRPDLTLGLSPHSDPGGITLLLPDDGVAGLQVRRGDAWVAVNSAPDALVVNVGDQIQVLSNGCYKSIEHRVVVNSMKDRLSLALFYNPRSDILLGPAPELLTPDQPALYHPMTFSDYRLYIRKRGPQGKSQVDSLRTNPIIS